MQVRAPLTRPRRDPNGIALAFEATKHLDPAEQATVKDVIEALLLKHEARRWTNAS